MNPLMLGGLFDVAKSVVARVWPDPAQQSEAQQKLLELQQTGELAKLAAETDLAKLQIQNNIEEAKSANVFIAGWRPMVGWVGAVAFGYAAIVEPILRFVAQVGFDYTGAFPALDTGLTMQVLFGILGLGALRTYEKKNDVEGKR